MTDVTYPGADEAFLSESLTLLKGRAPQHFGEAAYFPSGGVEPGAPFLELTAVGELEVLGDLELETSSAVLDLEASGDLEFVGLAQRYLELEVVGGFEVEGEAPLGLMPRDLEAAGVIDFDGDAALNARLQLAAVGELDLAGVLEMQTWRVPSMVGALSGTRTRMGRAR